MTENALTLIEKQGFLKIKLICLDYPYKGPQVTFMQKEALSHCD